MDDGAAKDCLICGVKFTFTTRRHHCRVCAAPQTFVRAAPDALACVCVRSQKCGKVVCSKCSKYRARLANSRSGAEKRICQVTVCCCCLCVASLLTACVAVVG